MENEIFNLKEEINNKKKFVENLNETIFKLINYLEEKLKEKKNIMQYTNILIKLKEIDFLPEEKHIIASVVNVEFLSFRKMWTDLDMIIKYVKNFKTNNNKTTLSI